MNASKTPQVPSLEDTLAFIKKAHEGQVDKAGNPYWKHPEAVMRRLPEDEDIEVKHAALLHDILEDTSYTREDLTNLGYSERTLDIVELVTKKKGDTRGYAEKIEALIQTGNMDAIRVKCADMSENAAPQRLAMLPEELQKKFLAKYAVPLEKLRAAIDSAPIRKSKPCAQKESSEPASMK